eukprot:gene7512-10234_t
MRILTNQDHKNLHNYQYKGGDSSLIYKYLLSPFAQFCVDYFVPKYVAPNVVTLLGLCATVVAMILTLIYNPQLSESGPRWLHLLTGLCIIFYQTLDNMDGKQARKTNSSSPLGMLFDHVCDAINAGVLAIPMASVLGTGWSIGIFFELWCGFVPFYFQTWEEYYVGGMILPIINGPSEGLLLGAGACFLSYTYGANWWQQTTFELSSTWSEILFQYTSFKIISISPFIIMVSTAVVGAIITVISLSANVISVQFRNKKPLFAPLLEVVPFIVFFSSIFIWSLRSDKLFSTYPVVAILLFTSIFVEINAHIMTVVLCKREIRPFQRYTAWLISLLPIYHIYILPEISQSQLLGFSGEDIELILLLILTIFSTFVTSRYLYQISTEIADALGIYIFILGKKKTANQSQ